MMFLLRTLDSEKYKQLWIEYTNQNKVVTIHKGNINSDIGPTVSFYLNLKWFTFKSSKDVCGKMVGHIENTRHPVNHRLSHVYDKVVSVRVGAYESILVPRLFLIDDEENKSVRKLLYEKAAN